MSRVLKVKSEKRTFSSSSEGEIKVKNLLPPWYSLRRVYYSGSKFFTFISPSLDELKVYFSLFTILLSSCNGIFEGIYDQPFEDEEETTTDEKSNITHFVNFNVNGYDSWIYLDLRTCKVTETIKIPTTLTGEWDGKSGISYKHGLGDAMTPISELHTDAQPDAEQWDIAIHHFDVKTNGLSAYETSYTSFDQLPEGTEWLESVSFVEDEWTTNHVLYDLGGMLNYDIGYQNTNINRVLTSWVTMDLSTPPPIYTMSDKIRIVKLTDGEYVAIKLYNYMNSMGLKGYLTFDVKKYD